MEHKPLTLYELNSLVREVVETSLNRGYWVEAELSEAREVRGHCYMELIQKDPFSATPVARASAKCWKNRWNSLRPKFEHATGQPLHAGLKVLLWVTANFHEAYGFSWIVQDLDPTYTLGDMARKRMEIIRQLKAEGVFELQKELHLPMFAQRVAVISSENAAGYGDFCNHLLGNDHGLHFETTLFPAVMQGDQVEASVIAALDRIYEAADLYDVVVIIRGGGATADLSGFETLRLAENVANFPLPIITGIGHERDESVLDMVAYQRVKTPTAAATFLIDNLMTVSQQLDDWQEIISQRVGQRLALEYARLETIVARIPALVHLVHTRQEAHLERLATSIVHLLHERLTTEHFHLERLTTSIAPLTQKRMETERHRLDRLELRAKSLDPALLLRRGYSITLIDGRVVRDPACLHVGDVVETRVEKGTFTATVKTTNTHSS
jgi:exodeoxyribonuclease VII large subunit